jgi:flavin-binding protein dodecin
MAVYKKIELVGSSKEGLEDAIRVAVKKASETLHNLDWFEVKEIRGRLDEGEAKEFQVVLQVGFKLD